MKRRRGWESSRAPGGVGRVIRVGRKTRPRQRTGEGRVVGNTMPGGQAEEGGQMVGRRRSRELPNGVSE